MPSDVTLSENVYLLLDCTELSTYLALMFRADEDRCGRFQLQDLAESTHFGVEAVRRCLDNLYQKAMIQLMRGKDPNDYSFKLQEILVQAPPEPESEVVPLEQLTLEELSYAFSVLEQQVLDLLLKAQNGHRDVLLDQFLEDSASKHQDPEGERID